MSMVTSSKRGSGDGRPSLNISKAVDKETILNLLHEIEPRLNYLDELINRSANTTLKHAEDCLDRGRAFIEDGHLDALSENDRRRLHSSLTSQHEALQEILLAQSFQDLGGQVLNQVKAMTQEILSLFGESLSQMDTTQRNEAGDEVISACRHQASMGPRIPGHGDGHSAKDQKDVDDLLAGMGL